MILRMGIEEHIEIESPDGAYSIIIYGDGVVTVHGNEGNRVRISRLEDCLFKVSSYTPDDTPEDAVLPDVLEIGKRRFTRRIGELELTIWQRAILMALEKTRVRSTERLISMELIESEQSPDLEKLSEYGYIEKTLVVGYDGYAITEKGIKAVQE